MTVVGAWILWHFDPGAHGFYPRCTFHQLTGWQCPGCGGLRATHALLHGRVAESWNLNPLPILTGPALLIGFWLWHLQRMTKSDKSQLWARAYLWLVVVGLLIFGIVRNLPSQRIR
ncbi:MAG: DUF2752 domain-containing protein [Verrucomicrobiota bacterium]|nr:DUF2752 domain-containing protein [Verrucomicrobiota bacterium]